MDIKEQAERLGIKIDGRWSEARIEQEILKAGHSIEIPSSEEGWEKSEISTESNINRMNTLANRIFEGQGSIPDVERVQRIVERLENKGYTPEEIAHLDIPIENLDKWI